MAEVSFLLDELTPLQAFHLLAEAAKATHGVGLEEVRLGVYGTQYYGTSVTVVLPDYLARGNTKKFQPQQEALAALLQIYGQITEREPRRREPEAELVSLAQSVGLLLLSDVAEKPALPQAGEFLLLAPGVTPERAAAIVEELRFHATDVRITAAHTDRNRQAIHLFHLLADPKRRSSFQSAWVGRRFPDCIVLSAFADGDTTVFLPEESRPSREGLHEFCRLLRLTPALFRTKVSSTDTGDAAATDTVAGREPDNANTTVAPVDTAYARGGELLAAVNQQAQTDSSAQSSAQLEFYYLRELTFYEQGAFTPPLPDHIDIEVHSLTTTAEGIQRLRSAIAEAEPLIAYRLALRQGRYQEFKEAERNEYQRLSQQQLDIEYRLAYLSSINAARPTLLRFTQKQLPALADVIRSIPMKFLQGEDLLYGFQAVERYYPAGLHYLLKSPHVVMDEMNPLPQWEALDKLAMHFWLDPLWSRYYRGRGNECWVFVPKGMTLFPPMHCWDATDMDTYLRDVLSQWFHGQYGVASIPEKAIYLFEPSPHAPEEIHISVLDQRLLQPLHTQLGWFNDNLAIMNEIGIDEFIRTMANDIAKRDIAARISQEAEKMVATFATAAEETSRQIAAKATELTTVLTAEVRRIVRQAQTTTEEIRDLNQRLAALQQLYDEMRRVTTETETLVTETDKKIDETTQFTANLRQRVETALADAQDARQEVQERVAAEVALLEQTHADLRTILARLREER